MSNAAYLRVLLVVLAAQLSMPMEGSARPRASRVQRAATHAREDLARSPGVRRLFGLSSQQIRGHLSRVKVVSGASRYESRGWARRGRRGKAARQAKSPKRDIIVLSSFLGTRSAAGHESRHALHHAVASNLFAASSSRVLAYTLRRVEKGVLGDRAFVKQIRSKGTDAQRKTLRTLERLARGFQRGGSPARMRRLVKLANGRAGALGALVYQHAYYVDPGMCEAAASHGDRGFTRLVTGLNGLAGRGGLGRLPGMSYMAGYGNKKMQQQFRQASPWKKALLVPKASYDRANYFKKP